ncbi:hypothetical protein SUGI_0954130 [Cryptomeria japonica]|nr:hypothetical protein SUGI_0954130 [Cryptomeria japonica]
MIVTIDTSEEEELKEEFEEETPTILLALLPKSVSLLIGIVDCITKFMIFTLGCGYSRFPMDNMQFCDRFLAMVNSSRKDGRMLFASCNTTKIVIIISLLNCTAEGHAHCYLHNSFQ